MSVTPPMAHAIILWQRGQPIPVDLWVQLQIEGHDMVALEKKYRK
ncbi:hypothetical protein [Rhizobium sp. BK376]|nr:hypothetical protein [Rhizobium sp. BK376]TCR92605.1 hypothetical protein EV561_10138 [Rhizobium sp. BK376]